MGDLTPRQLEAVNFVGRRLSIDTVYDVAPFAEAGGDGFDVMCFSGSWSECCRPIGPVKEGDTVHCVLAKLRGTRTFEWWCVRV